MFMVSKLCMISKSVNKQIFRTFSSAAASGPKVDPQFQGPSGKFSLDKFFEF